MRTKQQKIEQQIELQHKIQSVGYNIVNCGNCGSIILHECDDKDDIDCPYCGRIMAKSDCSDFLYTGLELSTEFEETQQGEFVNDGSDYQLLDYVFSPFNTNEGFTNIEVEDFEGNFVGEIAGVEIPDEYDKEEIIKFEEILVAWLKGEDLI